MQQKQNKFISWLLMLSLMALIFNTVPLPFNASAAESIIDAQDLISDSDTGASATHTFTFTTVTATPAGGDWFIDFPAGLTIDGGATANCGYGAVAGTVVEGDGGTVTCTFAGGQGATSTAVIVATVTNEAATGTKYIDIQNRDDDDVVLDRITVAIAITDDVLMTATVDSSLTFEVRGTSTGAVVNGVTCEHDTTATTTDFGTLAVGDAETVCQDLHVTTNADDGYIVTVEQDDELRSDANSTINSFNNSPDGTGTTTPEAWASPDNVLNAEHTYGHMGLTSSDDDVDDDALMANDYNQGAAFYVGLNGYDTPTIIMAHNGPADGATQNYGYATVAYTAEIASLQEAGDYENRLTYICTPTF